MFDFSVVIKLHCFYFRNALNIVKDDLIAKVDELSRYVAYPDRFCIDICTGFKLGPDSREK